MKQPLYRHARLAGLACRLVALGLPLLTLLAWYIGTAQVELSRNFGDELIQQLSAGQILLAILLSLLPTLAMARSLFCAASCFDCFAGADWFSPIQPIALAGAGRWLVLSGLFTFLAPTLLGFVITLSAPAGARALIVSLSSNGVLLILFGLLFWSLGTLWAKANALAAENVQFV
ncbi:hypothetical protein [Aliiroseovarius sp. 2305UL8-7]|uniref:hypothetical protein n=1 Tax=Aliiroseovarius conchicola TaxID=3121637 RepID=UPI003527CB78